MSYRIAVLFAAAAWVPVALATIPRPEIDALTGLFNATNGAYWKSAAGWLTDTPVCSWRGVTCDATQEHVMCVNSWRFDEKMRIDRKRMRG
jgi:Leucine rich repeat N-terminal domain